MAFDGFMSPPNSVQFRHPIVMMKLHPLKLEAATCWINNSASDYSIP